LNRKFGNPQKPVRHPDPVKDAAPATVAPQSSDMRASTTSHSSRRPPPIHWLAAWRFASLDRQFAALTTEPGDGKSV
jgi:hypothetical protein